MFIRGLQGWSSGRERVIIVKCALIWKFLVLTLPRSLHSMPASNPAQVRAEWQVLHFPSLFQDLKLLLKVSPDNSKTPSLSLDAQASSSLSKSLPWGICISCQAGPLKKSPQVWARLWEFCMELCYEPNWLQLKLLPELFDPSPSISGLHHLCRGLGVTRSKDYDNFISLLSPKSWAWCGVE